MTRYFCLAAAILAAWAGICQANAGQPYSSYWHPNTLLEWSPESDPDAAFNKGSVGLNDRFTNPSLHVNPNARHDEAKVQILSAMNRTTSNAPSQGHDQFDTNAFGYWQYVYELVYWGGSAGEGIIVPPSGEIIDMAHRNGVYVLGTIFFPPTAYGGQFQWVNDFLQRDGDSFPVADKLIEVAEYYGFDGWFFNQETAGGNSQTAADMREFMEYIQNNSDLRVSWYDAMIKSGQVWWQNALNHNNDWFLQHGDTLVSQTMFLNFWWNSNRIVNSRNYALNLGRDPYDVFAGVDVEGSGYHADINWDILFPPGQPHRLSLAFYRPCWAYTYASGNDDFYYRENRFWTGPNLDPSNPGTAGNWRGISHYVPAQSPVNELPFVTNFGTGHGRDFYVDGQKRSEDDWSNRALQDILPTWRWAVQSGGSRLNVDFDWSDAYYGGNSLRIHGYLNADNLIRLYMTDLPVEQDTVLELAYRVGPNGNTRMRLRLSFEDDPDNPVEFPIFSSTTDWETMQVELGEHAGRTITEIAMRIMGNPTLTNYSVHLGRIGIFNSGAEAPEPASNLEILEYFSESGGMRVRWDRSPDRIYYYNLYQELNDGTVKYLGSTPNDHYYIQQVSEQGDYNYIYVEAVDYAFNSSGLVGIGHNDMLTGHWRLNETAGTTADDSSVNQMHAELRNDLSFDYGSVPGIRGRSLEFNGVDDYMELGRADRFAGNGFSVTFWAYPRASSTGGAFIDFGNGPEQDNIVFARVIHSSDSLEFYSYAGSEFQGQLVAPGAVETNKWQFFAATVDQDGLTRIYKDGQVIAENVMALPQSVVRANNYIGRDSNGRHYAGRLDDIRVFNYALSQEQIQGIYDYQRKLVHHWQMNDQIEWTISGDQATTYILDSVTGQESAFIRTGTHERDLDAVVGGQEGATEQSGSSILLNGMREYIQLGDVAPGPDEFTISFWFNMSRFRGRGDEQNHIISAQGGQSGSWSVNIGPGMIFGHQRLQFWQYGFGNVILLEPIERNVWHHIKLTRNGAGRFNIYLDGQLVHSADNPMSFTNVEETGVWIGKRPSGDDYPFAGWIDDVRIYNYAIDDVPDLTDDGLVGYGDLSIMVEHWLAEDCRTCLGADVNLDGRVDMSDMAMLAEHWLRY